MPTPPPSCHTSSISITRLPSSTGSFVNIEEPPQAHTADNGRRPRSSTFGGRLESIPQHEAIDSTSDNLASQQPKARPRSRTNPFRWSTHSNDDPPPPTTPNPSDRQYNQQVVDLLDAIDPEVSTATTLSDLQNSLFIPSLGNLINRTRNVRLTHDNRTRSRTQSILHPEPRTSSLPTHHPEPRTSSLPSQQDKQPQKAETVPGKDPITGEAVEEGQYFVLPKNLCDTSSWTKEEREDLDDYVRHLLHSKRWRIRRTMRGFKHYVSTPLGAFVTIYASLLFFWGAAWFLFLLGWIGVGNRQAYFVEICDQILVALFCVVGLGMAPWRTVDTYHMIYIAHFHRKTLRLRRERGLPKLTDENDLPNDAHLNSDLEAAGQGKDAVLNDDEQKKFLHHQTKFAKSHTYYRPHETATHKAFPLDLMIVVTCLLDCHSLFQIALGTSTWSISYHRPFKKILTSVILAFSISCNITAGLVITVGNRRTRKTAVLEKQLRQRVTEEAVHRREASRQKAEREAREKAESDEVGLMKEHKSQSGHASRMSSSDEL